MGLYYFLFYFRFNFRNFSAFFWLRLRLTDWRPGFCSTTSIKYYKFLQKHCFSALSQMICCAFIFTHFRTLSNFLFILWPMGYLCVILFPNVWGLFEDFLLLVSNLILLLSGNFITVILLLIIKWDSLYIYWDLFCGPRCISQGSLKTQNHKPTRHWCGQLCCAHLGTEVCFKELATVIVVAGKLEMCRAGCTFTQELRQALRQYSFSGGQSSVVCCSPWGHKESDTT